MSPQLSTLMMFKMKTVRDICKYIGGRVRSFPVCVETGCTYVCPPGNEVHTTTNNILEYICAPKRGRLISVDIDPEHIGFCSEFVSPLVYSSNMHTLLCGDSVDVFRREFSFLDEIKDSFPENDADGSPFSIDVLCLDSKEFDEDHMVNEYDAVSCFLSRRHWVMVDDIHNPNSVKYKKMVPKLVALGYDTFEVSTPTGMLVAYMDRS